MTNISVCWCGLYRSHFLIRFHSCLSPKRKIMKHIAYIRVTNTFLTFILYIRPHTLFITFFFSRCWWLACHQHLVIILSPILINNFDIWHFYDVWKSRRPSWYHFSQISDNFRLLFLTCCRVPFFQTSSTLSIEYHHRMNHFSIPLEIQKLENFWFLGKFLSFENAVNRRNIIVDISDNEKWFQKSWQIATKIRFLDYFKAGHLLRMLLENGLWFI